MLSCFLMMVMRVVWSVCSTDASSDKRGNGIIMHLWTWASSKERYTSSKWMSSDSLCNTRERCIPLLKHSQPFLHLFFHTGDISLGFAPVQRFTDRILPEGLQLNFMLLKILAPILKCSQLAFDSSSMAAAGFWRFLRRKRWSALI